MSKNSLPWEKRPKGRIITNYDIEVLRNQCCCGKCKFCDCVNSTCKLRHKTIMVNKDEYEATKVLVRVERIFMGEEMPIYEPTKGFVPQYKDVYEPINMQTSWCQYWQHKEYTVD